MNYIVGKNSNQIQMIALEQLVAPDSWARVIDLFVDILPIDELGFKHVKLQSEGRPSYNPVTLLELYLYGHKHSIRSSKKLEHSCKVNVELWWLCLLYTSFIITLTQQAPHDNKPRVFS